MSKKKATAADRHKGKLLPARASDKLRAALQEHAKRERRSVAQSVIILLEEGLEKRGLWTPTQQT